jgi:hypothetical protein
MHPVYSVPYFGGPRRQTLSQNDIYSLNYLYGVTPNTDPSSLSTYGSWDAKANTWHQSGRIDGDGWASIVGRDPANSWMVYGPYALVSGIIANKYCCSAFFELMIDNITANNDPVAVINVNYTTSMGIQKSLISRTIRRGDFNAAFQYKSFELDFEKDNLVEYNSTTKKYEYGSLEFRVLWVGSSYVRVRKTFLKQ